MQRSCLLRPAKPVAILLYLMFALTIGSTIVIAAEVPRAGGELVFAVGETPPSYDGHRETTFGMQSL